jgi:hypothetical protein
MSTKQNKNVTFSNTEPKVDLTWHGTEHEENFPGTTELKENFRSSGTAVAGQEAQRQFERAQPRFGQTGVISKNQFYCTTRWRCCFKYFYELYEYITLSSL